MIHITGQDVFYNQACSLFFIVYEVVWIDGMDHATATVVKIFWCTLKPWHKQLCRYGFRSYVNTLGNPMLV